MRREKNQAPERDGWRPGQLAWVLRAMLLHRSELDPLELIRAVPFAKGAILWAERRPMIGGLTMSALGFRRPIFIDHPIRPEPRFGYGRPEHPGIKALLEANRDHYAELLGAFAGHAPRLAAIPVHGRTAGTTPYWDNGWLPPLDALALYGFIERMRPLRYVEIGSGNSTKFARYAIDENALGTRITSIDPAPRAHIDALCDEVIRTPLERTDLAVFSELGAGDIVFFDGSHRILMGSDVTVFFFEVLPRLRPGVLVHIHDVMLPADYPPDWRWRYYSEQYLLAAILLANPALFDIEWPSAFINGDTEFCARINRLWEKIEVTEEYRPASCWLRIKTDHPDGLFRCGIEPGLDRMSPELPGASANRRV